MKRPRWAAVLGLVALCVTGVARAEDRVSIRYLPGYPLPARASERMELRVERTGPATRVEDQEIDRFFSQVQAALAEHRIVGDWQSVIPDDGLGGLSGIRFTRPPLLPITDGGDSTLPAEKRCVPTTAGAASEDGACEHSTSASELRGPATSPAGSISASTRRGRPESRSPSAPHGGRDAPPACSAACSRRRRPGVTSIRCPCSDGNGATNPPAGGPVGEEEQLEEASAGELFGGDRAG